MPLQSAFTNAALNYAEGSIVYAANVPLTTTEADLFNQPAPPLVKPPAVQYGQAIFATVLMTAQGGIGAQTSYVILQTEAGGNWIDAAWATWTGTSGTALFALSGGPGGAFAYQQSRQAGTAPAFAIGANQMPLGGRIRFVGQTTLGSSSSSSLSGALAGVLVSINYKILGLR